MATIALRYIKMTRAGRADVALGILYSDGMVLALEPEASADYGLLTGASLLRQGATFTAIPAGSGNPFASLVAPCSLKYPNTAAPVSALLFKDKVFLRDPNNAGRALALPISVLVEGGVNIISRNGPDGIRWG